MAAGDWSWRSGSYNTYGTVTLGDITKTELPDDFTEWVERVQKQNRMEELIQKLYDVVMAAKVKE